MIINNQIEVIPCDGDLKDYKLFCFNGIVKFFKVDFGRFIDHHANYYTPCGSLLPFGEADFSPLPEKKVYIPSSISEMVTLAEKLSRDTKFLRVDFYSINNKVYFGEMTFFPASGMGKWTTEEWDYKIGEYINLKG